jgi:hypothetical protein
MAAEISTQDSEHRLLLLFDYYSYLNFKKDENGYSIDLTDNKLGI